MIWRFGELLSVLQLRLSKLVNSLTILLLGNTREEGWLADLLEVLLLDVLRDGALGTVQ